MDDVERTLEDLIDHHSIQHVLDRLASVCWGKGEHLRSNWQDTNTARAWDSAAKAIDALTVRADVRRVS